VERWRKTLYQVIRGVTAQTAIHSGDSDRNKRRIACQSQRFGESVNVRYYDLFDPACLSMPPGVQLPLVLVNSEVLSCGGKISVPVIREKIETILKKEIA